MHECSTCERAFNTHADMEEHAMFFHGKFVNPDLNKEYSRLKEEVLNERNKSMQTDDILRGYSEYAEGVKDFDGGVYRPEDYPLISSDGLFLKKAYKIGWYDRRKEQSNVG